MRLTKVTRSGTDGLAGDGRQQAAGRASDQGPDGLGARLGARSSLGWRQDL
jgi:hypothetical protein